MKNIWIGVLALSLLTACGVESDAKSGLKSLLNDPSSVQFFDLKRNASGKNVCGAFNAKNRMGGYVGRTPFFYEGLTATTAIVPPAEDSDFRAVWLGIKLKSFEKEFSELRHKCRYAEQWRDVCDTPYPAQVHALCQAALSPGDVLYQALKDKYDK